MSQWTPQMAKETVYWDTYERYTGFAATTPYVWPTGCPPLGSIQNYTVRREPGDNIEKVIFEDLRIVWAMGDGPDWVRCLPKEPHEDPDPLPSGAPNNAYWTYSRSATYSPGVCPTGWDAMNVGVTSRTDKYHDQFHGNSGDVKSTAVCCMRGDSIDTKLGSWFLHCVGKEADDGYHETVFITKTSTRRLGVSTSVSSATWTYQYYSNDKDYTTTRSGLQSDISFEYPEETHTYTWTTGQFWYPAWSIVWDNNDTSTMSPKPPALTNDMLIPTWTEGMVLEDGKYDNGGRGQALGTVTTTGASEPSTTTNRNAVTTPFVFSSGCLPPGFVSTITQQIDLWETITERIRFLFHLDREWRNCLPDVEVETTYNYPSTTVRGQGFKTASYSAAVCPSGWWALNMGLSTYTGWNAVGSWDSTTTVFTTAKCCSSWDFIATPKYENGMVVGGFDDHCVESRVHPYDTRTPITIPFTDRYTSWIKIPSVMTSTIIDTSLGVTTTSTSSYFLESPSYSESSGTHTWTEGQFFYPLWSIVWQDSDTSTMSPKPPALSNDMLIRTWYPGMQIVSGWWDWRGSGAKSWTQTVTATEMATTTETVSASTVVRMHYVQVAGPGGVDEEEMIRSGLLPPKIVNKPVENSVETGDKVASATEVDGMVLVVRLLLMFLWLSFMVGGAWMFWLKRRMRGSKGEIELEERVGGPPHYMEVPRQERGVSRRDRELPNANDNTTDHAFQPLNDDMALRVEVRKS